MGHDRAELSLDRSNEHCGASSQDEASVDELMRRVAHISNAPAPSPTELLAATNPGTFVGSAEVPRIGSVVDGRYQIESVLGEGGMGVVLAARNLRTGRPVALKYMHGGQHAASRDKERAARLERFLREAQAAGRIRNPHVVDIFDAGGTPELPFLVMERLFGESLATRMKRAPLRVDQAVRFIREATRGVAAAHEQGVIHRDLKPENLFLSASPEAPSPVVKVLDFGVSRIVDPSSELSSLTCTGTIIGTPAYMPLEQLRAERDVDARSDVYALGTILYEAVAGRRPYEARSMHDQLLRMATEDPVPLHLREPATPHWLSACVAKCLARDPEQRYASAGELLADLEREAAPRTPFPRTRWTKRRAVVYALALGLGLVMLALRLHLQRASLSVAARRGDARALEATKPDPVLGANAPATLPPPLATPAVSVQTEQAAPPPQPAPTSLPKARSARSRTATVQRARELRPEDF